MADQPEIVEGDSPEVPEKEPVQSPIFNTEATPLPREPEELPESPPADDSGATDADTPVIVETPPTVVPDAPEDLLATVGQASGKVTVTFTAVEGADQYEVFWTDDPLTPVDPDQSTTYRGKRTITTDWIDIENLTDFGNYQIHIRAINAVGPSDLSDPEMATPAPPPAPDPPTNLQALVRIDSGRVDLTFDEMERAETYDLYWTDQPTPIDPLDPLTYLGTTQLTTASASVLNLSDGTRYRFAATASHPFGTSALCPEIQAVPTGPTNSLQPPAPSPESAGFSIWSKELPKVSFLPLRLVDEELGRMFQANLQRLHPLEEPKSLQEFLKRDRMLYFSGGEGPMEILNNLYRINPRQKVKLPVVVLHRLTAVESWDTEHSLMPHLENHPAMLGFHPIRLNYTLSVLAFEQPVCDTLVLALYSLLKSNYRFDFPIEGHDFFMKVSGLFLDTAALTFSNEMVTREETRLYASRADFSVGTFSYHLPAETVQELPVRFVFDRLTVQGNQGHKA